MAPSERLMVGHFIVGLKNHVGAANAITNAAMLKHLKATSPGLRLSGPRIRKIINYIRCHRLVENVVATSNGYYIETDPGKLLEYVESLRDRASAILNFL